jgi:hypothetical protein
MRRARFSRTLPAIGLGLALSSITLPTAVAQPPSTPDLRRAITGSGDSPQGFRRQDQPPGFNPGREGSPGINLPPLTPGAPRPGRPGEPRLFGDKDQLPQNATSTVSPDLFIDARAVNDPGERALALVRIALTAIPSKQLDEAHIALFEAGPAALAERDQLIREQRITAIVDGLLALAEERMSDTGAAPSEPLDKPPPPPSPVPSIDNPPNPKPNTPPATSVKPLPSTERISLLRAALPEWARAVELARRLDRPTARTETLFRIVESEAFSSQRLITEPLRQTGGQPDPSALPPELRWFTDYLLASAAVHAALIERPIWRDFSDYIIVSNAAASSQFTRGFQIARAMVQPEARTNALIRLAEGQALNGRPNEATAAYEEAARSVALIPQEDPRETLVGVLIDSLISFGRFDDARACVPIYSFPSRQLVALSAVAESQGKRNLAGSARLWIAQENPAFQPLLYRKVNDGILKGIEQNRSKTTFPVGDMPRSLPSEITR